ncbi:MAG: hypothetical protein ACOZF0_15325 [Thermodesulfobacteriota bacterium]
MRLTSLYIGQYKNLRDFSLRFDLPAGQAGGSNFIDVFVGNTVGLMWFNESGH